MLGSIKSQTVNNINGYYSIFEDTLDYDHEGVIEADTWKKTLDNDDCRMYHLPRMLGEDGFPYMIDEARDDGMLQSIVNQATATNACSFDTRKVPQNTQNHDDNDIDGCEYSSCMVPTADNRNSITSSMDALVPCFNNNYGSADPSKTNVEMILDNDTWLTNINEEEGSQVLVIQEQDDQVLPQQHGQEVFVKEDAQMVCRENVQVLPQWYPEVIVPEEDVDQMVVPEKDDVAVPPLGYTGEKSLFTGESENACNVTNEKSEMRVDHIKIWPSACQTRTDGMHRSLGQKRGSTSSKLPSSKKGKGMKAAASRKHNKSEQNRREMINQKMNTLHDLVPYHSKTVNASKALMLTEVIQYVKGLQAQVQTMKLMRSTVPYVIEDYPTTTNTWQLNNMYSVMGYPLMNTTVMDINCINTHIGASTSFPAVLVHPTTALSPGIPSYNCIKSVCAGI